MIENKDQIVLDATNNVLVGPDGYFKIVIDAFDGKTIQAWHIEGPGGVKSSNLAELNDGPHLDAIVHRANGTVGGLYTEMAPARLLQYLPQ